MKSSNILFSVLVELCLLIALMTSITVIYATLPNMILRKYVASKVVLVTPADFKSNPSQESGSGFHVESPSGQIFIITNRHICHMSTNGRLWVSNTRESLEVEIILISDNSDLCLISPIPGIKGLKVAKSFSLGQVISYLGHPRGQPHTFTSGEAVGEETISVRIGVVGKDVKLDQCQTSDSSIIEVLEVSDIISLLEMASVRRMNLSSLISSVSDKKTVSVCYEKNKALTTTLTIYGGASGSPIVDRFGRVISVVYAAPNQGGWGWGVTLTDIKTILEGR